MVADPGELADVSTGGLADVSARGPADVGVAEVEVGTTRSGVPPVLCEITVAPDVWAAQGG